MRDFQVDVSNGNVMDKPWRTHHEKFLEFMRKQYPVNDQSLQNEVNKFQGNGFNGLQLPHINFTACIAFTRDVADTEQLVYTTLALGEAIFKNAIELWEQIVACHSESSNDVVFSLCFISELENSGDVWESILSDLYSFLSGLEKDPLITDFKKCLGQ